jgi:pantoate--beta-alanine ligase
MGALHAGHASLIDRARNDCSRVIVSVFVNPLQFDRDDDLRKYPRTLDADRQLCGSHGVDLVFAPAVQEMYPTPLACRIDVGALADHLCGKFRPGHFQGVATVVMKLFQIVQADRSYFGEKDAQQLAIVRRLVRDLNVPTEVVGVPTVREPDGLALSSRNRLLSPDERELAPALYVALSEASRQIAAGVRDPASVRNAAIAHIPDHQKVRVEYLEIVGPDDMQPVDSILGTVCVAGALWVGSTRLIDNIRCTPSS